MNWVAFYSHTGNEIAQLSLRLGRWPELVVTNQEKQTTASKIIKENTLLYNTNKSPTVEEYIKLLHPYWTGCNNNELTVTLHGWMRIIPPAICDVYDMYNLHPGLITKYPELKGKDPQCRITEEHDYIGCVIHDVISEVDSGNIISEYCIRRESLNDNNKILKSIASNMWYDFLKYKLC